MVERQRGRKEAWLDERRESSRGIWLKLAKKGSGAKSITRFEAIDVALCFGWIDGQTASVDETYTQKHGAPERSTFEGLSKKLVNPGEISLFLLREPPTRIAFVKCVKVRRFLER